ncbi:MAG: DUF89 family protein [Promethearchaeota archaeon]|nr:MAG: DUF89 family protein [Candidatus Lokiarchaeota archaeon]
MKLEPECVGCFFNQIMKALRLLNNEITKEDIINTQKKFMDYLISIDIKEVEAPLIGKKAYELIAEVLNCLDPYSALKRHTNELALQHYDEVKEIVLNSEDPLFHSIIVSALANTIDFASQHEIELISDLIKFDPKRLVINDYINFNISIKNADYLLIIGDNSGEIVFDKLLIEIIQKCYPRLEIIYAVRSVAVINDATMEDAEFIGLDKIVEVIKSGPTPGVNLDTATEEFKKYFFMKNTVILSKGQGNFESLYGLDLPDQDLFYLFMAKCNLIERILKVRIGDLILKKKSARF